MLTFDEIQWKVDEIRTIDNEGDYERAHGAEDRLYTDFITAIAKGDVAEDFEYLRLMAAECLKTQELEFPRYCA